MARPVPHEPPPTCASIPRRSAGLTLAKFTEPPYEAEPTLDVPTPRWTWIESTTLAKSPKFEK